MGWCTACVALVALLPFVTNVPAIGAPPETRDSAELVRAVLAGDHSSADLSMLEELTPETAKALAAYRGNLRIRCPGGRITPELLGLMMAAGVRHGERPTGEWTGIKFTLVGLEVLTPEDVSNLAKANPFNPWLGGIKRLEPETVRAIVAMLSKHSVYFPDLEEVPVELAQGSFLNEKLTIGFDSGKLARVSPDVARAMAAGVQEHHLYGLQTISPEAAEILLTSSKTHVQRSLFEKDWELVRRLSPEARAKLERTGMFEFDGIQALEASDGSDVVDAGILASLGNVGLPSLTRLSPAAAKVLATAKGRLALPALAELSPEVARGLAAHGGWISLPSLKTASPEAARALVGGTAKIDLPGIERLSPELAAALASGTTDVELYGITSLDSPDAAHAAATLAAKRGELALPNLRRVSPKVLARLIAKEDILIPPVAELVFIAEPDGSPTEDFVVPDDFARQQRSLHGPGLDPRREARVAFPLPPRSPDGPRAP